MDAFRNDGTLITGAYAQQVIVVLIPPGCDTSLGLQGGSPALQPVYLPVATGVCGPATNSPAYSVTAADARSDAIELTWSGAPIGSPGTLYAYATDVPQVTLTFP